MVTENVSFYEKILIWFVYIPVTCYSLFLSQKYIFFLQISFFKFKYRYRCYKVLFYISKFVVGENIKNAEKNVKHFVDHVEDSLWDLIVVVFHSKLFVIYRLDACFLFISPFCQYWWRPAEERERGGEFISYLKPAPTSFTLTQAPQTVHQDQEARQTGKKNCKESKASPPPPFRL